MLSLGVLRWHKLKSLNLGFMIRLYCPLEGWFESAVSVKSQDLVRSLLSMSWISVAAN